MKSCELCQSPARIFCESDQASLCWNCDFKVHGANFLVARHSRNLLCQACQLPTPWSAAGAKLGPTVSLCVACSSGGTVLSEERENHHGDEIDLDASDVESDSIDGDDEDDDNSDGDGEDDGDNQVVPWSSMPQPPEPSSSSGEEDYGASPPKRVPEFSSDLRFQGNMSRSMKLKEGNHPGVD